ncbi:DinB family protein [Longimicrobium sp.]|uniref:DinB family protein n=1 Tax=Longimicrobium sp. TaxID=2029185 RepID=UPI002E35F5D9|nr:DinB family protein [Longimicrobium sp.]HEX6040685.1 DinB family protein [Longimicrobium sp.]
MRPRNALLLPLLVLPLLLLTAGPARAQAPPPGFREEILRQFNNSMQKFIELAEAMPEDRYAWSPGEGVMPVARVYAHVARYNYFYPATSLGVPDPDSLHADATEQTAAKTEVVALLRRSRDHVRQTVMAMTDEQLAAPTRLYGRDVPQWAVLLQLVAHMNEHLGQSIAYARMNGVVPPWSQ